MVDVTHMVNEAGMDSVVQSARTRANASNPLGVNWLDGIGAPFSNAYAAGFTLTAANLLTGICVLSPSAASLNVTFDTATNLVNAVTANSAGAVVGDYICCLIVNGSANAIPLVAGSGGGFDTNQGGASQTIAANSSKYVMIRVTNVTAGSQAYVIYS